MKRIIRISFSVFLVMGAVVLLSLATQANAESVSKAWTGEWSCSSANYTNDNYDWVKTDTIRYMIINADGTVDVRDWVQYQIDDDWIGGYEIISKGTVSDETYPTIGFSDEWGDGGIVAGRCIGKLYDSNTGAFLQASCNSAVHSPGDFDDYIEEFECARTVVPK